MSGYTLVLPFDTDDPEFVRGFEVGRLWEKMKLTPEPFEETVHSTEALFAVFADSDLERQAQRMQEAAV